MPMIELMTKTSSSLKRSFNNHGAVEGSAIALFALIGIAAVFVLRKRKIQWYSSGNNNPSRGEKIGQDNLIAMEMKKIIVAQMIVKMIEFVCTPSLKVVTIMMCGLSMVKLFRNMYADII